MAEQSTPAHPANMSAQPQTSEPPKSPIVTTSRLIIRQMCEGDAPSIAHNANNPLVTKYMSLAFPHPYTLSDAEDWISMQAALPHQDNFVICERSCPDAVIGGVVLKHGADVYAHTAEVGFWIGQAYWGKGYTTEILEGFTTWSFESWKKGAQRLRRLWGGVFHGNGASMRCFEKCGYAREGVMKGHGEKHGVVMDLHLFGMTKQDWEERRSRRSSDRSA